ncbi:serine/threonine-protein kinase-like protein CCR4 [Tripterygium wilfordii]|nr:serine/threonine-protein kinase-like protein CCR4 [Tripterygium wilfordii]
MAHSLIFFFLFFFSSLIPFIHSLSTVSISRATSNQTLVCALTRQSSLNCSSFPSGIQIPVNPNTSFSGLVGGDGFMCALTSFSSLSTSAIFCWRFSANGTNMEYKRIYNGTTVNELEAGDTHICGLLGDSNQLDCWQWREFNSTIPQNLSKIAVAGDSVCGLSETGRPNCTPSGISTGIANVPNGNYSVIAAGSRHACAINSGNSLDCWGDWVGEIPQGEFISLALGDDRSCALRTKGSVVCWGQNNFSLPESLGDSSFISIEAKRGVFCGVLTVNFSLQCWGNENFETNHAVFEEVLPGPCRNECPCGPLPYSGTICGQGYICQHCETRTLPSLPPVSPPSPPPQLGSRSDGWSPKMVAFLVMGCVGSLASLLVLCFFCLKYCKIKGCRVHDSGPLEEATEQNPNQNQGAAPPVLQKRLSQLTSMGNAGNLEEFSLQELLQSTNNFGENNKIGTGSFGAVYYANLTDGREVAIKRAETSNSSPYITVATRREQDKDTAFINELESLSRLNHKNLVRLLGFCEDSNERVLVYEYMTNGTLHDHLHKLGNSPLMSWSARIKVALDAARGIEYLHVYAVPPIIHRDIKSSNILIDDTWTAKVSDFGLSMMGPVGDESHVSLRVAGTVGYVDPEYYRLQQVTTKSDVYSFAVVLLEMLSGCKAIHKNENGVPRNVVDYMVPYIVQDEIDRVLDPKVPPPTPFEREAVRYVGYLAADCVTLEGRDRPSMTEIVDSLERAFNACLVHPSSLSRSTTGSST